MYYWKDLKKDKTLKVSTPGGGAFHMVWTPIPWNGQSEFTILNELQGEKMYCTTLERHLISFKAYYFEQNHFFEFKRDSAPIHSENLSLICFVSA